MNIDKLPKELNKLINEYHKPPTAMAECFKIIRGEGPCHHCNIDLVYEGFEYTSYWCNKCHGPKPDDLPMIQLIQNPTYWEYIHLDDGWGEFVQFTYTQ